MLRLSSLLDNHNFTPRTVYSDLRFITYKLIIWRRAVYSYHESINSRIAHDLDARYAEKSWHMYYYQ